MQTPVAAARGTPGRVGRWWSAVPMAVGIAGAVGSVRLSPGSLTSPGPGFWPLVVSVAVTACSAVLLVTGQGAAGQERFGRRAVATLAGLASLAVFILLFQVVGFILPGAALLVFWLRWLGGESWRLTLPVALLIPVGLHLLFVELLGVPFPPDLVTFCLVTFWR